MVIEGFEKFIKGLMVWEWIWERKGIKIYDYS